VNVKVDISVVIPTHNRADALDKTLSHLSLQSFDGRWEVIVVANNCSDNTNEVVADWASRFPVRLMICEESKAGAAAARNTGASLASGDFIVFLDNDILVETNFLASHFAALKANAGNWIVGRTLNLPEQNETTFGQYRLSVFPVLASDKAECKEGFGAANVSMARSQFELLGGFDENFFEASGEDRELALRAAELGIRIIVNPEIVVLHNDWAGSTIRDFCARQRTYTRTEPYFWLKYGDKTPRLEMVRSNLPPKLNEEAFGSYLRKQVKRALGSDTGQALTIRTCEIAEKMRLPKKILWPLYRLATAGAIYRGFQEGLERILSLQDFEKRDV
jgi:GT2 family glycosyltransferase